MSQCGCGCGGGGASAGGGGFFSGGGGGGGGAFDSGQGDYVDSLLSTRKFCFKCATFWIIILILAFLAFAKSGK